MTVISLGIWIDSSKLYISFPFNTFLPDDVKNPNSFHNFPIARHIPRPYSKKIVVF